MIKEHDCVVLTADFPEHGFKAGDVGVVVLVHDGGAGYEIEIFALDGRTLDVITVGAEHVRMVGASELIHARRIA